MTVWSWQLQTMATSVPLKHVIQTNGNINVGNILTRVLAASAKWPMVSIRTWAHMILHRIIHSLMELCASRTMTVQVVTVAWSKTLLESGLSAAKIARHINATVRVMQSATLLINARTTNVMLTIARISHERINLLDVIVTTPLNVSQTHASGFIKVKMALKTIPFALLTAKT